MLNSVRGSVWSHDILYHVLSAHYCKDIIWYDLELGYEGTFMHAYFYCFIDIGSRHLIMSCDKMKYWVRQNIKVQASTRGKEKCMV